MNITEKILSKKAGYEVNPGEIIEINVDLAMSHDGTSPPTIKSFEKIIYIKQRVIPVVLFYYYEKHY